MSWGIYDNACDAQSQKHHEQLCRADHIGAAENMGILELICQPVLENLEPLHLQAESRHMQAAATPHML